MKISLFQAIMVALMYSANAQAETGIVKNVKPSILKSGSLSTMDKDLAKSLLSTTLKTQKSGTKEVCLESFPLASFQKLS